MIYIANENNKASNNIISVIEKLGIEYTHDNTVSATNILYNIESYENLQFIEQLGLPQKWIAYKDVLIRELKRLNLPYVDSICPNTREDIQNFFQQHNKVFTKPVLYNGGSCGNASELLTNENALVQTLDYTLWNSYEQFENSIDIENLLSMQNNDNYTWIPYIFQEAITTEVDYNFYTVGCVNGEGDFFFLPIQKYSNNTYGYLYPANCDISGILNNSIPSDTDILQAGFCNPDDYNVDIDNINDTFKTLINSLNIRNSFIMAQGFVKDGLPYLQDISFRISERLAKHPNPLVFEDLMKFTLDIVPEVTIGKYQKWSSFSKIEFPVSLNRNIVETISTNFNIYPLAGLIGNNFGYFICYADTKNDLINNIKNLKTYMNTL
jgi:hypothetical protein